MNRFEAAPPKVVWARRGVVAEQCPRSLITAESLARIEEFEVWRTDRAPSLLEMDALKADAFWILENERARECANGQD